MRQSILDQIKLAKRGDSLDDAFAAVKTIADLSAILHGDNERSKINIGPVPGAYLLFAGESAGEFKSKPGQITQSVTKRWTVVIVTRSRNDAAGGRSAAEVDDLVDDLDEVLLGFSPSKSCTEISKSASAGSVIRWTTDYHFYASNYEVTLHKRKP